MLYEEEKKIFNTSVRPQGYTQRVLLRNTDYKLKLF